MKFHLRSTTQESSPHPDEAWRKSSFSMNGDCVEVARFADSCVCVRDSKTAGGPVLHFTVDAWATFIGDVQSTQDANLQK